MWWVGPGLQTAKSHGTDFEGGSLIHSTAQARLRGSNYVFLHIPQAESAHRRNFRSLRSCLARVIRSCELRGHSFSPRSPVACESEHLEDIGKQCHWPPLALQRPQVIFLARQDPSVDLNYIKRGIFYVP